MRLFVLAFISIFIVSFPISADETIYRSLVEAYTQAVVSQDDGAILSAWEELDRNPDAQIYMEREFPLSAYSFKMMGIALKLSRELKNYQDAYGPGIEFSSTPLVSRPLFRVTEPSNQDIAQRFPNQEQMSQQRQVALEQKAGFMNNQVLSTINLNQDQRSNQALLQDDLNRMGLGN